MHQIKNDLKIFNKGTNYDLSLHEKATDILNNWKVSIEVVSQAKYCIVQSVKGCSFTLYFFRLRSAGSEGRICYVPSLSSQTTCLLGSNSFIC